MLQPRVLDDMTIEVALSLMDSARVEYLLLCDGDDQTTGAVTRTRLTAFRDSSAYTDRTRLREVLHPQSPVPSPPWEASCAVSSPVTRST
nr:CBS domain-containing protein [Streptomyces sp. yr375]